MYLYVYVYVCACIYTYKCKCLPQKREKSSLSVKHSPLPHQIIPFLWKRIKTMNVSVPCGIYQKEITDTGITAAGRGLPTAWPSESHGLYSTASQRLVLPHKLDTQPNNQPRSGNQLTKQLWEILLSMTVSGGVSPNGETCIGEKSIQRCKLLAILLARGWSELLTNLKWTGQKEVEKSGDC